MSWLKRSLPCLDTGSVRPAWHCRTSWRARRRCVVALECAWSEGDGCGGRATRSGWSAVRQLTLAALGLGLAFPSEIVFGDSQGGMANGRNA
jgi:hypothetical protein